MHRSVTRANNATHDQKALKSRNRSYQVDIVQDRIETLHLHTPPEESKTAKKNLTAGKGKRQFKDIGLKAKSNSSEKVTGTSSSEASG